MRHREQLRRTLEQLVKDVQVELAVIENGTYASSASRSWQSSCQGTMFE